MVGLGDVRTAVLSADVPEQSLERGGELGIECHPLRDTGRVALVVTRKGKTETVEPLVVDPTPVRGEVRGRASVTMASVTVGPVRSVPERSSPSPQQFERDPHGQKNEDDGQQDGVAEAQVSEHVVAPFCIDVGSYASIPAARSRRRSRDR